MMAEAMMHLLRGNAASFALAPDAFEASEIVAAAAATTTTTTTTALDKRRRRRG
jgi:hypothetical protein